MTTSTTTTAPVSQPRQGLAITVVRRCGELFVDVLMGIGSACTDPLTCSSYWIGSSPAVWGFRK